MTQNEMEVKSGPEQELEVDLLGILSKRFEAKHTVSYFQNKHQTLQNISAFLRSHFS